MKYLGSLVKTLFHPAALILFGESFMATVLRVFGAATIAVLCSQAMAAPLCAKAHRKIPWQTSFSEVRKIGMGDLDLPKIKREGFKVQGDSLLDRDGTVVGVLKAIDVRYLYEWAPKEYHQAWLKAGGIDSQEMRRILGKPGQTWGRGFYVSMSPFDSSQYGSTLTVFPVERPLIWLLLRNTRHTPSAIELERFGQAGIDFVAGMGTWFALISSRHLRNPKSLENSLLNDWKSEPTSRKDIVEGFANYVARRDGFLIPYLKYLFQIPGIKTNLNPQTPEGLTLISRLLREKQFFWVQKILSFLEMNLRTEVTFSSPVVVEGLPYQGTQELGKLLAVITAEEIVQEFRQYQKGLP